MDDILGEFESEELKVFEKKAPPKKIKSKRAIRKREAKKPLVDVIIEDDAWPDKEEEPGKLIKKRGEILEIADMELVNLEREKQNKEREMGKWRKYKKDKTAPKFLVPKVVDDYDEEVAEENDNNDDDSEKEEDYGEGEEITNEPKGNNEGSDEDNEENQETKEKQKQDERIENLAYRNVKKIRVQDWKEKFVKYNKLAQLASFCKKMNIPYGRHILERYDDLKRVIDYELRYSNPIEYVVGPYGVLLPLPKPTGISYLVPKDIITQPTREFIQSETIKMSGKDDETIKELKDKRKELKIKLKSLLKDGYAPILDEKEDEKRIKETRKEIRKLKLKIGQFYKERSDIANGGEEKTGETRILKIGKLSIKLGVIENKLGTLRNQLNVLYKQKDAEVRKLELELLKKRQLARQGGGNISNKEISSLEKRISSVKRKTNEEKELEKSIEELRRSLVRYEDVPELNIGNRENKKNTYVRYWLKLKIQSGKIIENNESSIVYRPYNSSEKITISKGKDNIYEMTGKDEITISKGKTDFYEINGENIKLYKRVKVVGYVVGKDKSLVKYSIENYDKDNKNYDVEKTEQVMEDFLVVKRLGAMGITDKIGKDEVIEFLDKVKNKEFYPKNFYDERFPVGTGVIFETRDTVYKGVISIVDNFHVKTTDGVELNSEDEAVIISSGGLEVGGQISVQRWTSHKGIVYGYDYKEIFVKDLKTSEEYKIPYEEKSQGDIRVQSVYKYKKSTESIFRREKIEDVLVRIVPDDLRKIVLGHYFNVIEAGVTHVNESGSQTKMLDIVNPITWERYFATEFNKWSFPKMSEAIKPHVDFEGIKKRVEDHYRKITDVNGMLNYLDYVMANDLFAYSEGKFLFSGADLLESLRGVTKHAKDHPEEYRLLSFYLVDGLSTKPNLDKLRGRSLGYELYLIFIKYLERMSFGMHNDIDYEITMEINKKFNNDETKNGMMSEFNSLYGTELAWKYHEYVLNYEQNLRAYIETYFEDTENEATRYFNSLKNLEELMDKIENHHEEFVANLENLKRSKTIKKEEKKATFGKITVEDLNLDLKYDIAKVKNSNLGPIFEEMFIDLLKLENKIYKEHKNNTKDYLDEIMYPYVFLGTPIASFAKFFRAKFFSGKVKCDVMNTFGLSECFPELSLNRDISSREWEKVIEILYKIRNVVTKNIVYIYYSLVEPSMKFHSKTIDNSYLRFIADLVVDPRQVCKMDTGTGQIMVDGEPRDIPDADLVICANDDKFTCHSTEALVQQFKSGNYINHITGQPYSREFVERMLRRGGVEKEITPYVIPIAKTVGLIGSVFIETNDGLVPINLFDIVFDIMFAETGGEESFFSMIYSSALGKMRKTEVYSREKEVDGQKITFVDRADSQNEMNIYSLDLMIDGVDISDLPFTGRNDHLIAWNVGEDQEFKNELKNEWLTKYPFIKSVTFSENPGEHDYPILNDDDPDQNWNYNIMKVIENILRRSRSQKN